MAPNSGLLDSELLNRNTKHLYTSLGVLLVKSPLNPPFYKGGKRGSTRLTTGSARGDFDKLLYQCRVV
jgi:hypothetical protein